MGQLLLGETNAAELTPSSPDGPPPIGIPVALPAVVAVYEGAECDVGDERGESEHNIAQQRAQRIRATMARIRNFRFVKSKLSLCSFGAVTTATTHISL